MVNGNVKLVDKLLLKIKIEKGRIVRPRVESLSGYLMTL